MNNTLHHTNQILTKRPQRVVQLANKFNWPPNIWMGTSVENQETAFRINYLGQVPAHVHFLSCEPLIGPIYKLDLNKINWVKVGGEGGAGARPMEADWVRDTRDQCHEQAIAFFFKQWGGAQKHKNGRILDERTYDEYPKIVNT